MSGFICLTYEAPHKPVKAKDNQVTMKHNKHIHLENSMVMYTIYNAETLDNLIHTVHSNHNFTTEIER